MEERQLARAASHFKGALEVEHLLSDRRMLPMELSTTVGRQDVCSKVFHCVYVSTTQTTAIMTSRVTPYSSTRFFCPDVYGNHAGNDCERKNLVGKPL